MNECILQNNRLLINRFLILQKWPTDGDACQNAVSVACNIHLFFSFMSIVCWLTLNSFIHLLIQSISQSLRPSVPPFIPPFVHPSVRQTVSQKAPLPARPFVSQSDSQSVRESVRQTDRQSVSQTVSQSVGRSVSQSVNQTDRQTISQPVSWSVRPVGLTQPKQLHLYSTLSSSLILIIFHFTKCISKWHLAKPSVGHFQPPCSTCEFSSSVSIHFVQF